MNPLFRLELLLLPPACHICARILNPLAAATPAFPFLCESCREALPWKNHHYSCRACGRPTAEPDRLRCPACASEEHHLARVWCAFHYEEVVRRWILSLKYRRNEALTHMLGALLHHVGKAGPALEEYDMVLPVPLHPKRLRRRGFNQAYLLAHAWRRASKHAWYGAGKRAWCRVGKYSAPALRTDILQRHRHTRPQVELPADEREANVAAAFSLYPQARYLQQSSPQAAAPGKGDVIRDVISDDIGRGLGSVDAAAPLAGLRVLLVDDLMTTGATLNACAATLREDGAERVDAFVLARA